MKSEVAFFHKQLGDVLLMQPSLLKLAKYVGHPVALATKPAFEPMISLMEGTEYFPFQPFKQVKQVWVYETSSWSTLRAMSLRAERKNLFHRSDRNPSLLHRLCFSILPYEWARENYRAQYYWEITPGDGAFVPPKLSIPPEAWLPLGFSEKNYILIHPTAAWRRKTWLTERWAETINRLAEHEMIVFTGGYSEWEKEYCEAILKDVKAPVLFLAGRTSLRQLLRLVYQARLVLTIDGAVSHISGALGRPCVTLFGAGNHPQWYYQIEHSALVSGALLSGDSKSDLSPIQVEHVLEQANRFLR